MKDRFKKLTTTSDGLKICCTCNNAFPLTKEFFHVRNSSPDGFRCDCKQCRKENIPKKNRKIKMCFYCNKILPNTKDFFNGQSKGGLRSKCKECSKQNSKINHLSRRYNISIEEYEKIKNDQKNKCAICFIETKLFVDHCHKTNIVRGLLCDKCNRGIGFLKEKKENFENAILYLNKNENTDS